MFKGVARGRTARGDVELAVDGTEVGMDGARAEKQFVGYLLIGQASSHQAQHLDFACGQVIRIG